MSFANNVKKFWNGFENLFMKNHTCLSCGKEIPDGTDFSLCAKCLRTLEKIEGNLCPKCGEEIHFENLQVCDFCKDFDYKFDKNNSCFYYHGAVENMVKNFKYNGKKYIAKYIALVMSKRYEYFENADMLAFVPINKSRRRERGFNQSEEIAKELEKLMGIPVVDIFEKDKRARHQAGLSQAERLKNLKGSFKLKNSAKDLVGGKNVIIIDDVFTTGTTLSECAGVLLDTTVKSINTLTFAKTKFIR